MDKQALRFRFGEVIASADLILDDVDTEEGTLDAREWLTAGGTRDLHEPELARAILCHTFKQDDEFVIKIAGMLGNTAMDSITKKVENGGVPDIDDAYAMGLSANILFSRGFTVPAFQALGALAQICAMFKIDIPAVATAIMDDDVPRFAKALSLFDPYDLLDGLTQEQAMDFLQKKKQEG